MFPPAPHCRTAGRCRKIIHDQPHKAPGWPTVIDIPEGWGNRAKVDNAFAAAGINRTVSTEVVSFAMALELVRQDLGVVFLPELALENGSETGTWSVKTPLSWRIQLARSATRQPTAAEQVVIRKLTQDARQALP